MEELGITPSKENISEEKREFKSYNDLLTELSNSSTVASVGLNSDVYLRLKKLEREHELLTLQEDYIKDEQRHLKRELLRAQEEVKRIQSVPLVIGQFLEPIDQNTGIVSSTTGMNYVVESYPH